MQDLISGDHVSGPGCRLRVTGSVRARRSGRQTRTRSSFRLAVARFVRCGPRKCPRRRCGGASPGTRDHRQRLAPHGSDPGRDPSGGARTWSRRPPAGRCWLQHQAVSAAVGELRVVPCVLRRDRRCHVDRRLRSPFRQRAASHLDLVRHGTASPTTTPQRGSQRGGPAESTARSLGASPPSSRSGAGGSGIEILGRVVRRLGDRQPPDQARWTRDRPEAP